MVFRVFTYLACLQLYRANKKCNKLLLHSLFVNSQQKKSRKNFTGLSKFLTQMGMERLASKNFLKDMKNFIAIWTKIKLEKK